MPARKIPLGERFWAKVNKTETCWLWTGGKRPFGYGFIWYEGRNLSVHRLSFEMHHGPIPEGMVVCHRCDVPSCLNPDHLFLGSQSVNVTDCVQKNRHAEARRTHCPAGHEYTEANTYQTPGRLDRNCRACRKQQMAAYHARTKKNTNGEKAA